jgi:hypothetical protein
MRPLGHILPVYRRFCYNIVHHNSHSGEAITIRHPRLSNDIVAACSAPARVDYHSMFFMSQCLS